MGYRLLPTVLLLLTIALPTVAGAAMYAYVDDRGVKHYSNVPGDGRFRMIDRPQRRGNPPEDQLLRTISRRSNMAQARSGGTRITESKLPSTLNRWIHRVANTHGVDPLLVKAVIKAESNFDPNAVSPKGAQGLMQLMPGTARDLKVSDPFDPLQNIDGGTRYLRYLLDNYQENVELSLAAYNAGPGRVAQNGVIPSIPETQAYVAKVMQTYRSYKGGVASLSNINVRQMVTVN
ncbi:MAG: lytic transglycosylase domain-containing protein [Desulfobulbus sp.]|jgi:soluble lytic murein transglycosylase-like protein|nr:lytic transglycosylase domain-containing protein [Desulfobulbus sp.]